jgi:hypothetical protein
MTAADVIGSIRDLTVHLHRGNVPQAESIVTDVVGYLNEIILAPAATGNPDLERAQQTMFAIEEVRMLMSQRDYDGAATAARDAAKEWRSQPVRAERD